MYNYSYGTNNYRLILNARHKEELEHIFSSNATWVGLKP